MSATRMQQVSFVMPDRYTPIPDYFFDVVFPTLNGSELKALLYILRHTYGYQKGMDAISYSQFLHGITRRDGKRQDAGAGLSERALVRALGTLESKGHMARLNAVGRATYYRACMPEQPAHIRETPATHPPKAPAHVPQPPANSPETRDILQETPSQETMQPASEPLEPIIAVLTSIGVERGKARSIAREVVSHGQTIAFVRDHIADARNKRGIYNLPGFVAKFVRDDLAGEKPSSEGSRFNWLEYEKRKAVPGY